MLKCLLVSGSIAFTAIAIYFVSRPSLDIQWQEKAIFSAFFVGAVLCLTFSWMFHTVYCHSERVGRFFNKYAIAVNIGEALCLLFNMCSVSTNILVDSYACTKGVVDLHIVVSMGTLMAVTTLGTFYQSCMLFTMSAIVKAL